MLTDFDRTVKDAVRCPRCTAERGELCFGSGGESSMQYQQTYVHWPERWNLYHATVAGQQYASANCPTCGRDTPHPHEDNEHGMATVRIPALLLKRLVSHGEVIPSGIRLMRLIHFLRAGWVEHVEDVARKRSAPEPSRG